MQTIKTFGAIGTGIIGTGWAARALARGLNVLAFDPGAGAQDRLRDNLAQVWPVLERTGLFPGASVDRLRFCDSLEEVALGAQFIQESAPERIELKTTLHAQIDAVAPADVLIASSTSGLLPSEFQSQCAHPGRVMVGHPFNPVYLLPLVEVLGGEQTDSDNIERAVAVYRDLGMYPLKVRCEVPGFLSDRLQEALWREILHLVNDDVATPEELDAAICYGPGLRWALWGTCQIFHVAAQPGGMGQFLKHFDPSLFPWTHLEPPKITGELADKMHSGCERLTGDVPIDELERVRDDALIGILEALQQRNLGAGAVLNQHQKRIRESADSDSR
jgi:carnitine 3-dehydrogenase